MNPCYYCEPPPFGWNPETYRPNPGKTDEQIAELNAWSERDINLYSVKDAREQNNTLFAEFLFMKDKMLSKHPEVTAKLIFKANHMLCEIDTDLHDKMDRSFLLLAMVIHQFGHVPNDRDTFEVGAKSLKFHVGIIEELLAKYPVPPCIALCDKKNKSLLEKFGDDSVYNLEIAYTPIGSPVADSLNPFLKRIYKLEPEIFRKFNLKTKSNTQSVCVMRPKKHSNSLVAEYFQLQEEIGELERKLYLKPELWPQVESLIDSKWVLMQKIMDVTD